MRALVTGVAGFVGSSLAKRLLVDGHELVGVDALTDYYDPTLKLQNLAPIREHEQFEFVKGDLNLIDLDALLDGIEVIFHQAGQPGVRSSWGEEFSIYTAQNIEVTQRLLEAARRSSSLKRFVYASSSSVYGDAERFPTHESDRPQPKSPYGVTKLAAEHLCVLYAQNFDVPTVSLRYFTVYGPGQRPDMAFTRFLRSAWHDEVIPLFGTGQQIRDFTYIDDVVQANLLAATVKSPAGSVFNVSGGSNISVSGVLDLIGGISGKHLRIERQPSVAGDVFRTGGEAARIEAALGWRPVVSIEEGLANQYEWIRRVY